MRIEITDNNPIPSPIRELPFETRVKPFRDFIWVRKSTWDKNVQRYTLIPIEHFKDSRIQFEVSFDYPEVKETTVYAYSGCCVLGVYTSPRHPYPISDDCEVEELQGVGQDEFVFIINKFDSGKWSRDDFMEYFGVVQNSDGTFSDAN